MTLEHLSKEQWSVLSRNAHLYSFGDDRPPEFDRINYALWVHDEERPCAYSTVIEIDARTAYMQHGGAFPGTEKTLGTVKAYAMITNYLKNRYDTLSTQVRNFNVPMIKLAFTAGFLISGAELNGNDLFVKLLWKK